MNAFEGGRRIALIIALIGLISASVAIYSNDPYIAFDYEVAGYGLPPTITPDCKYLITDARESIIRKSSNGSDYNINICFRSSEASDGRMLVPFKTDGKFLSMNEKYSTDVEKYTNRIASSFNPSAVDKKVAEDVISKKRRAATIDGLGYTLLGIFVFWLFVSGIGWIVRGFFGIPNGKDRKPDSVK